MQTGVDRNAGVDERGRTDVPPLDLAEACKVTCAGSSATCRQIGEGSCRRRSASRRASRGVSFVPLEDHLLTESRNPRSEAIDARGLFEIVRLMNAEDARVVRPPRPSPRGSRGPSKWLRTASARRPAGLRRRRDLGPSGRPGRHRVPADLQFPPRAGGRRHRRRPCSADAGGRGSGGSSRRRCRRIDALSVVSDDPVVGIATSGRTPYVLGAVRVRGGAGR